jgi:hypothetical protein
MRLLGTKLDVARHVPAAGPSKIESRLHCGGLPKLWRK